MVIGRKLLASVGRNSFTPPARSKSAERDEYSKSFQIVPKSSKIQKVPIQSSPRRGKKKRERGKEEERRGEEKKGFSQKLLINNFAIFV